MKIIIANEVVGARNPPEDSRKQLLEAKRKIYEKIRAQLAKERPITAVCPRMQRLKPYEYGYPTRTYD
jgi:hypothetical protein